jgi:hypothetical protein
VEAFLHRLNFRLDKLVKFAFVDVAESVEAGAANDFLFKPFVEIGALFSSNEDIDFVDAA